ncbi:hypothetical protein A3L04_03110 [Thermococcus chitonophagus]|uniref:ATP-dependent protease La Type I n=1 Tax=Thermococcus chitonophagus TaxID=54262 RepID=A0A170T0A3_9EURY|nr:hypothetical protein [Thermococcus chitonophagus]ASJ16137.1 hypothetical protein A3L04_03110 [Thermococcus chitonophagus]CUX78893.1 ATP-dependent protease La Type I [Thermococcus chitonophagus]
MEEEEEIEELRRKLIELSKRQAALNFKIYQLFMENRTLAIRLSGYIAENKSLGENYHNPEIEKIIDKYLFSARNKL